MYGFGHPYTSFGFTGGLLVTAASLCVSSYSFIFESNSKSVVAWVTDPVSTPWRFHNLLCECVNVFRCGICWSISHMGRTRNEAADILVRFGLEVLIFLCLSNLG